MEENEKGGQQSFTKEDLQRDRRAKLVKEGVAERRKLEVSKNNCCFVFLLQYLVQVCLVLLAFAVSSKISFTALALVSSKSTYTIHCLLIGDCAAGTVQRTAAGVGGGTRESEAGVAH